MKTALTFVLALAASTLMAQPARFQEFQSAKIIQTVEPIFPESLIPVCRNGGQARVVIGVDASGKLLEWLILSYTRREFAEAAVRAVKEWDFEPARLHGNPVAVSIELTFHFEVKGVVVSTTLVESVEANLNSMLGGTDAYAPCTLQQLDRIPVPLNTVRAVYPEQLADRGVSGEVTVAFFIDEKGDVRMVHVVGRPHLALADLAVDAVRQWKFEPPTRKGEPVLVQVQQLFRFFRTAATKG